MNRREFLKAGAAVAVVPLAASLPTTCDHDFDCLYVCREYNLKPEMLLGEGRGRG
jgi:hypothetical protein